MQGRRELVNRRGSYRVANMALREEKVAASSLKVFSSFLSFIIVSVTMAFSFSYLLFRLVRATSAVWEERQGLDHCKKDTGLTDG